MAACATAHSQTRQLFSAIRETPLPQSRIHVGAGLYAEGFPNRCRHCNPAPCMLACLPGAIYRDRPTETVIIDPDRCINCASCTMACPFGVIRYHEDCSAPPQKTIAVKCDNCLERRMQGLIPACVEVCKSGALTFEEPSQALKRKTDAVSRSVSVGNDTPRGSVGMNLLNTIKRAQIAVRQAA
jgi:carbon-monoxide dehydrogenase iron sulfur subunit